MNINHACVKLKNYNKTSPSYSSLFILGNVEQNVTVI